MSTFNLKEDGAWRGLLVRALLVIGTVAVIVWSMPRENVSIFHAEKGKPWKYAEFTAPFDFPVYKSDAEILRERDSVMRQYEPYYDYNAVTEQQMVRKFQADYADGIPDVPSDYLAIISNRLHSLYQQGIMDQEDYQSLHADSSSMIRLVHNKQASSVSILEVYSPKGAYEQLFHDPKLAALRQQLQKCNLNNYLVPNLVFDRNRSETSRTPTPPWRGARSALP